MMLSMAGSTTPNASPWTSRRRSSVHQRPTTRRPLKSTTAPSPSSWKDTFKQGCLERARRKRQETIWRNRAALDNNASPGSEQETARQLVEDELRESGVAIRAVMADGRLPSVMMDSKTIMSEGATEEDDEYAISETELYELMQHVEEELQRDEARLDEEMEDVELCEQLSRQHIEDQIAEFEDWEAEQDESSEVVLCPICQDANLMQLSQNGVACPNSMNGSCPLRLERLAEMVLLPNLRQRLGTAYEIHACACSCPLEFQIQKREDDDMTLLATCRTCTSNVTIL